LWKSERRYGESDIELYKEESLLKKISRHCYIRSLNSELLFTFVILIQNKKIQRALMLLRNMTAIGTRYWREQQARSKLQTADETKQWTNEYKKQAAGTNTSGRRPL
jgi:hypothetical protein